MQIKKVSKVNSKAEDLFVQLFIENFGPDKAEKLYVQYPFTDIYGKHRFIDFALENEDLKIAIEIDGETYHNPKNISENKYFDDLLKQNSLIYNEWTVYRWAYNQLKNQPEKVKDELTTFLGESPFLKSMIEFLPNQEGSVIELRDYQQSAIDNLIVMRGNQKNIALLYHATGIGKTITAAADAKIVGGKTLFLVNALKLSTQAEETFHKVWSEATTGQYTGISKDKDKDVLFATIQTLSQNLKEFRQDEFKYIIVDECHHAASNTYKKILGYFTPEFILGLSATPERTDGQNMLELFQNVAHKMDLKTAIEKGILAPIRCIRVKTDIDISEVRINGIKYNSQDLESKLFLPERNKLIAETYKKYVDGRKSVVFCASVDHAIEISSLLQQNNVNAKAVSSRDKVVERNKILAEYEHGDINVLCACDLLNEGWDSPRTEVIFMARPTMSKTIYMQQLGRGTRKCEGKEDLLVFDFIDNANLFNMPYSLHRMLNVSEYRPLEYVLAPTSKRKFDKDLHMKGEKPKAYIELPIDVFDFEVIDLFNWQKEVESMKSQLEFVRMVEIQSETVEKYVREGKIKADISIPIGKDKNFNYYYEDTIKMYAKQYNWDLITPVNISKKFINFVKKMDMSYSYKPVLLKAIFDHCTEEGKVRVVDIVSYFIEFYQERKEAGLIIEKKNSLYMKKAYSEKDVENNIFRNPFKRFADMRFLLRCKDIEWVKINPYIMRRLKEDDIQNILKICDDKLVNYYARIEA